MSWSSPSCSQMQRREVSQMAYTCSREEGAIGTLESCSSSTAGTDGCSALLVQGSGRILREKSDVAVDLEPKSDLFLVD